MMTDRDDDRLPSELLEARARIDELEHAVASLQQTRSDFLAAMNHELRTPLNHIIGFSQVLLLGLAGDLKDEQRSHVETIARSAGYLLSIVNDVQDLMRLDAGVVAVEDNIFTADEVIEGAIELCMPAAVEKGLTLMSQGGEPLLVRSDRRRVRQVLVNLINNAIKFTASGTVTVHASARDSMVRFEVIDTGHGMSEDELRVAFDEFVQLPPRDVLIAKSPGAGLGLTISRRLVGLLGGTLQAHSEVGSGSVFWFEVSAQRA